MDLHLLLNPVPENNNTIPPITHTTEQSVKTSKSYYQSDQQCQRGCCYTSPPCEPTDDPPTTYPSLITQNDIQSNNTSHKPNTTQTIDHKVERKKQPWKKKKVSSENLKVLESEYKKNSYVSKSLKESLSLKLEMEPVSIRIWFQNKRQTLKKQLEMDPILIQRYLA